MKNCLLHTKSTSHPFFANHIWKWKMDFCDYFWKFLLLAGYWTNIGHQLMKNVPDIAMINGKFSCCRCQQTIDFRVFFGCIRLFTWLILSEFFRTKYQSFPLLSDQYSSIDRHFVSPFSFSPSLHTQKCSLKYQLASCFLCLFPPPTQFRRDNSRDQPYAGCN